MRVQQRQLLMAGGALVSGFMIVYAVATIVFADHDDPVGSMGTFRTADLIVDNTESVGVRTEWQSPGGRGVYVQSNEIDQGYSVNADDTLFINYGGYQNLYTRYRNLWVGNGRGAAAPVLYSQAVTARVGVNTASPLYSLDVNGTAHVSGNTLLDGTLSVPTGATSLGPLSGNGGLLVNPTTGQAYFEPFTSTANPWGFGFLVSTPLAPIDIADLTFAPGTANPRTDNHVSLLRGLANGHYDTTAGDLRIDNLFIDGAIVKSAGANRLYAIAARLDSNVTGGADYAVSLHLDKGVFWNSVHTIFGVRPSTGGGPTAPPVISACGAGPVGSASGNDNGGTITVGGGGPASCTLTFQAQWLDHLGAAITPSCLVQSPQGVTFTYTPSSTTLVINWAAGSPTKIVWHCFGTDDTIPGP